MTPTPDSPEDAIPLPSEAILSEQESSNQIRAMSAHTMGDGHQPVLMVEICPNAEENADLKRQVEELKKHFIVKYGLALEQERDQLRAQLAALKTA